ncbi:hypothetical protein NUU61_006950 [Penicillium alfredii]|uniref:Uncharacterized protein n=1 Tax=Penicillium alfredii TaxID=1506179 RepID=A0A9W9F264_9EURO|nr:uncharacterized protein NUU61_006950 [Penicillium alfredii]KAJ5092080.1 hypothetical protein NUU61_006950 [Penicillium alfredii]
MKGWRNAGLPRFSDVEEWQATYRKLDSELISWGLNLPAEYAYENSSRLFSGSKHSRSLHSDWVQLHATYQTASQRCLLAVDNNLSVTRFVVEHNMLDKLGPPFAFALWVSARLLLVHGSTIAHTVSPDILFLLSILWPAWRVLDEYGEYQQSAATDGERSKPSTVKILADMRRCAFDLDFLISRQPRESPVSNGNTNEGHQPGPAPILPARNLVPNELEYLDVFGFFNVPRVPPAHAPDPTAYSIECSSSKDSHVRIYRTSGK